jgi:hypothetical protein
VADGSGGAVDHVRARFMALGLTLVLDPAATGALTGSLDALAAALAPWRAPFGVATYAERAGTADELAPTDVVARLAAARAAYDPGGLFLTSHPAPRTTSSVRGALTAPWTPEP